MIHKTKHYYVLIAILLVGLTLRVVFCLQFRVTPFYRHPTLDAKYYDRMAMRIASGHLLQDKAFFMGPLYPYSLGAIYAVFGHTRIAPRIVQMLLGLGCCVLLFMIGCRVYSPVVGSCAAALYAIYKPAIFYEQTLLSETSMAFVCLVLLFLLLQRDENTRRVRWLAIGVMLGIAALLRGNVLLFAPALIVWLVVCERKDSGKYFSKTAAGKIALFLAGLIISIAPATIHNYLAERDFVLITSNAGFNFFIGNNEKACGRFEIPPRVDMDQDPSGSRIAERALGKSHLKSSEVSRYWNTRAHTFLKEHPSTFLKLLALKLYYFWGRVEIAQIYSIYEMESLMPVLKFPLVNFTIIGPLALIGLIYAFWRADRRKTLLVLFSIAYIFSLLPFFITARYRIPIVPVLCIFAAYSIVCIVESVKGYRWGKCLAFIASFAAVLFFLNDSGKFTGRLEAAQFHNALGLMYQAEKRPSDAIAEYRKAITAAQSPSAYANLATLYYERNDFDRAIFYYKRAIRFDPENARVHFNLGQTYLAGGKFDAARTSFEKAVSLDARVQPLAYYNLALLYIKSGEKEKAAAAMKKYLNMQPDDKKAAELFSRLAGKM